MKKRMIFGFLLALLLVLSLSPAAMATEENIASGTCGDGITWSLDGYTLTISGSGEMAEGSPWAEHKDHIEHVVFTGGVTKICDDAFFKHDRIETVDFGDDLVEIGEQAFYGCTDITYIHLPKTFRIFGAKAFRDCTGLKYVYCDGGMPRFNESCLWTGEYISVFYPGNNPWPAEAVNTLIHNFGGRLGVMMGSFEHSDVVPRETTEATEETEETEAVTETTQAPTEAVTEPTVAAVATEAATVPTTEAPTETTAAETEAPTTEAPTIQPAESTLVLEFEGDEEPEATDEVAEAIGGKGWIGMVLIAGVLTFLLIGALIFRILSRKGGRYSR